MTADTTSSSISFKKYLYFRLQVLTHYQVQQMEKEVEQIVAEHMPLAATAGRRTGMTDSIAAPFVLRNMQHMPGSTGGIVVPTFKHGLTNTIPGLLAAWLSRSALALGERTVGGSLA